MDVHLTGILLFFLLCYKDDLLPVLIFVGNVLYQKSFWSWTFHLFYSCTKTLSMFLYFLTLPSFFFL